MQEKYMFLRSSLHVQRSFPQASRSRHYRHRLQKNTTYNRITNQCFLHWVFNQWPDHRISQRLTPTRTRHPPTLRPPSPLELNYAIGVLVIQVFRCHISEHSSYSHPSASCDGDEGMEVGMRRNRERLVAAV